MEEELKQNTQQPKDGQSASPKHMSIRSILGGDILANDFFKRQTRLLILIMILTVLYIDNRYSSQQELIEIDKLKKDLIDIKYDALTRSSELMEKSRQSRIEEYISTEDSIAIAVPGTGGKRCVCISTGNFMEQDHIRNHPRDGNAIYVLPPDKGL